MSKDGRPKSETAGVEKEESDNRSADGVKGPEGVYCPARGVKDRDWTTGRKETRRGRERERWREPGAEGLSVEMSARGAT